MKKISLSFILIALSSLLPMGVLRAESSDRVIAVVNEEPITSYQLDEFLSGRGEQLRKMQAENKELASEDLRKLGLQKLIDDILLDNELKKRGISVTDEEVDKALATVLERNKLTQAGLEKELKGKASNLEAYKGDLRDQLKTYKFMGQVLGPRVKITDGDLDDFFAKNSEKFSNYQSVELAQILLPIGADTTSDQMISLSDRATQISESARRGAKFDDLAKKYGSSPQLAEKRIYQLSELTPVIAQALQSLKPGEVSVPLRSDFGWHIVKLYGRKTLAGEEYKAIREQIRERVFEAKLQQELQKYLDDLKAKSVVEIKS